VSTNPPDQPWGDPDYPPPPPFGGDQGVGGYPGGGYPPPPPPGYPPPPPPGYPPGGYPGGGYPGGSYPGGGGYYPPGGSQFPGGGRVRAMSPFGPLTGWWQRVGSTILDNLIVGVPLSIILVSIGVRGYALTVLISFGYAVYRTVLVGGPRGRTVGNRAVGTRVVDVNTGQPIGPSRAAVRSLVQFILEVIYIGALFDYLWPLWDSRKQTLHDKAAGCIVVMAD
jgi:uncharacterized RDD family membrane protein YckC